MSGIRLEQLTLDNFKDYEAITAKGSDGKICYCSFWHQKWSSMDEYDRIKTEDPDSLKNCVKERVKSRFHVGVIAYKGDRPCAWVSVGPLTDFFWTWKRVAQVGELANKIAGIMCFTTAKDFRTLDVKIDVLKALTIYAKEKGWLKIYSSPFSFQVAYSSSKCVTRLPRHPLT